MNYYFIGIKGTGMAALACILNDLGHDVCGSDLEKHFFTEDQLRERNIPIFPFSKDNIHSNMNIIIGNAFKDDFEEVVAAKADKTNKTWRYHEFLGELMKNYESYSVAGSHGKTTTTGMLSAMLQHFEPTGYLIGDGTGSVNKDSKGLVVESCEYRRHFLAYHPDYAIITNADLDHVDYFKDDADYCLAYEQFSEQVKKNLVVFGDDPKVRGLKINKPYYTYGVEDTNDFVAKNIIETPKDMSFDVYFRNELFGHFHLPFVGRHLLWNSLAVIAIGYLKGFDAQGINEGLSSFGGVKRRFVVEEYDDGNVFIDDYAHHPTEVGVTIEAAKMRYPDKKVIAIFKPHRVSRVYYFADQFAEQLKKADEVYLCPFTSIDDKEDGIDIDINYLVNRIPGSCVVDVNEDDAKMLAEKGPAVYLFMSSKDIYKLTSLVKRFQNKD